MDWKKRLQILAPTSFRDIFDANTESDQKKRLAQGQQRFYQDQQAQNKVVSSTPKVTFKPQQVAENLKQPGTTGLARFGVGPKVEKQGFSLKPNPADSRSLISKVIDQYNPNDSGRTFTNPGQQNKPNFIQRNLSPTGVFNIGKEIVQGTARIAPQIYLSSEEQSRRMSLSAKTARTKELMSLPYEQRKQTIKNNPGLAVLYNNADPTDANLNQYIIDAQAKATNPSWKPEGWQKRLFGEQPVVSYQQAGRSADAQAEQLAQEAGIQPSPTRSKILAPVISTAFLGLDVVPGGRAIKPAAKKVIKELVKEVDPAKIIKILEDNGLRATDESVKQIADATTKKEVTSVIDNIVKQNSETAVKTAAESTPNIEPGAQTATPPTSTLQEPKPLPVSPSATPGAQISIKEKYPALSEPEVNDFTVKLNNAKSEEERQVIENLAAVRQKEIELQTQTAQQAPETAIQAAKTADAQQMADSTTPVGGAVPTPSEAVKELEAKPEGATMADLNTLGIKASEYAEANIDTPAKPQDLFRRNLDEIINATKDLQDEGIPLDVIQRVQAQLLPDNALAGPVDMFKFKNAVRREAGKEPVNDIDEVKKAALDAWNRGDLEEANLLNDSLKESGNEILKGNFPAPVKTPELVGTPGTPVEGSNILMNHGQSEDLVAVNKAIETKQAELLTKRAQESPVAQLMQSPGDPMRRKQLNRIKNTEEPIVTTETIRPEAQKPAQNIIDTTTGEIPMGRPEINDAPTYSKAYEAADGNNLDDFAPLEAKGLQVFNDLDTALKTQGHSVDELVRALDGDNRGIDLPEWVTPDIVKQWHDITDDLYTTTPEGTGFRNTKHYVYDSRPLPKNTPMESKGLSMFAKIDSQFGATKEYTGAIPLEELDTGMNRMKRWVQQSVNDKFKYAKEAQKPEYKSLGNDPVRVKAYIDGRTQVGQKIAERADKEVNKRANDGKVKIKKNESPIIDDLRENYVKSGGTDPIVKNEAKLGVMEGLVTKRDALDHAGFYKDSGFKRIDEANITAAQIHENEFKDLTGLTDDEIAEKIYDAFPTNDKIGQTAHEDILGKLYDGLLEEKALAEAQGIPFTPSQQLFTKAERSFGQEELRNSLERTEFTDPRTKRFVDKLATRALAGNRIIEGKAMRTSREITSMFYSSLLGLKISTALQNLTEISRSVGVAGPIHTAKAITYLSAHPKEALNIIRRNGQDTNFVRQGSGQAENIRATSKAGKIYEGAKYVVMAPFNTTESFKDAVFLLSLENKFKADGLKGRALSKKVAETYNKTAFKGGEFGTLKGSDNPIGNAVFQFAQYPIKDISLLGENMRKVVSGTPAEKADAWKYLIGNYGTKAAMVIPAWYLLGWSAQQTLGIGIPKAGPGVSVPSGAVTAVNDEQERSNEAGEPFNWMNVYEAIGRKDVGMLLPGGDFLNQAGVLSWISDKLSGGNFDPFIQEGTLQEQQRGYGVNKDGTPRMAGQETTFGKFKQFAGGKYNSPEAKEYFGQSMFTIKNDLPGDKLDFTLFGKQRGRPLTKLEEEQFNKLKTKEEKNQYIRLRDTAHREQDKRWNEAYKKDKGVQEIRKVLNDTTYNKKTKKNESDIISPEKWKIIQSDKSGEYFANAAKDKRQQAKDFGLPLDPIFDGTLTPEQIKDVLAIRSAFTGDDRERKDILDQTAPWYKTFKAKEANYFDALEKRGFTEDPESKFGYTQRFKDYVKLGKEYPADTALIKQYKDIKAKDPEAGKTFFKNNLDALKADFARLGDARYEWTNKRRKIEGADPMPRNVYDNLSYGYEDDEKKLAQDLYWKNKDGYANGNRSDKKYLLSLLSSNATNASPITLKKLQTAVKPKKMKSFVPSAPSKKVRIRLK